MLNLSGALKQLYQTIEFRKDNKSTEIIEPVLIPLGIWNDPARSTKVFRTG